MKLFGGKQPEVPVAGRRRPLRSDAEQPGPSVAFSYYAKRPLDPGAPERQDTISMQRRRPESALLFARAHRGLLASAVAVILLVLGYFSTLTPTPRIVLLQDKTTRYFLQDPTVYKQTAARSLGRSLFNRNKLTVDTAAVRTDLLNDYPELKNVSVVMPIFGHQPQVYIEPYKPSFILTTTSSNAFLLDETGRALATTNQISDTDGLQVPTVQDKSGLTVQLGKPALPSTTVTFVQTVLRGLAAKDVRTTALELPANAFELDVRIAETPYYVRFNLQDDPLQQTGTYLAVRQRLASEHTIPAQYVDVRVPERAYYK